MTTPPPNPPPEKEEKEDKEPTPAQEEVEEPQPARSDDNTPRMDAASALQTLGDDDAPEGGGDVVPEKGATATVAEPPADPVKQEEGGADEATKQEKEEGSGEVEGGGVEAPKRYLPEHKKPDAAPTFPEKVRRHTP